MKQDVSETESNWRFRKNVKTSLQKQESVSDAAFKTCPFSCNFKFASKNDRVNAVTCKYSPLDVSPSVTNCSKELHLKYDKVPRSVFENFTMHEN